ncbi:MAG: hypothetical protein OQK56_06390 [Ignavibacteriaceae bacterium]|jgi:uncharacterized protein YcfL|nr:hypothetical protein [Ignavibacteriaceae bacterium]
MAIIITTTLFFTSGCSSRENSPIVLDDLTIVYPSKSQNGIYAKITFSNKISKKTGKPLKTGTVFKLRKKAKVHATIELMDYKSQSQKEIMLHIDWLDSTGNSLYKKSIDISPTDSSSSVSSSISISPAKRKVGKYSVRVYLFRELIAEKKFRLVKSIAESETVKKKKSSKKKIEVQKSIKPKVKTEIVKANILLCRKVSKKSGKPIGEGTTFTIREKAKVKAIVNFEKQDIKTNEQLNFYFKWIGPDGKSFYKKRVVYTTSNPSFTISSSISITSKKRQPGTYILQIFFHRKIIAEQKFELLAPTK